MNVLTAPIVTLLESALPSIMAGFQAAPRPAPRSAGDYFGRFFNVATVIAVGMIIAGICLLVVGTQGGVELAGKGLTLKTNTAGIALVALGLVFYLIIGAMLVRRMR